MLVLIAAAAAIALWQLQNSSPDVEAQGAALVGGPFELVDHTGRSVTQAAYAGDYLLVFFGFTFCPHICPMTLGRISVALDALGEGVERVRPLFISVDPERDTPEVLAAYVEAFHPRIAGLTGSAEQIKAVAKAYRVFYRRVEEEGAGAEDYMMDHSTIVYLMGPNGRYLRHFSNGTNPETMAASIRDELEGG
jgi:protein SCO1/2